MSVWLWRRVSSRLTDSAHNKALQIEGNLRPPLRVGFWVGYSVLAVLIGLSGFLAPLMVHPEILNTGDWHQVHAVILVGVLICTIELIYNSAIELRKRYTC